MDKEEKLLDFENNLLNLMRDALTRDPAGLVGTPLLEYQRQAITYALAGLYCSYAACLAGHTQADPIKATAKFSREFCVSKGHEIIQVLTQDIQNVLKGL